MSSLFTEAEIQLSKLALAALAANGHASELNIVVGGLGLGYTAVAALENPSVKSLLVIDVMQPVIDWHQRGLVPLGKQLTADTRCSLLHADFFQLATASDGGFNRADASGLVHAVLLDIDHSPSHWLEPANAAFYSAAGLQSLADKLHAGGIFGLWSNDPPESEFTRLLDSVFQRSESHVVAFANPYTGGEAANTVYLATK